jgi:hypothetical protein
VKSTSHKSEKPPYAALTSTPRATVLAVQGKNGLLASKLDYYQQELASVCPEIVFVRSMS